MVVEHTESEVHIPRGFSFAGIHCGIKAEKLDLAVIVADGPVVAAGVYTQNLVRAACIDWNRNLTPGDQIRAVVINSGNANACTGQRGHRDTRAMASAVASAISAQGAEVVPEQVLVLSTGVIGVPLPMERVASGIPAAVAAARPTREAWLNACRAIMTTDHHYKIAGRTWEDGGQEYRIAGMAKGAGMIGPNLATMLAVLVTDWPLTPHEAEVSLHLAAEQSFNCISVEGHTSTNDCALLLAPVLAAAVGRDEPQRDRQRFVFQSVLNQVCLDLALQIPTDGEGATHLIEIRVSGARTAGDADRIARTIALSNLVKTAVAGADPNWGRIVSAAGYAGVTFEPAMVGLRLNGWLVFHGGEPTDFDPRAVSRAIRESPRTLIELEVGAGPGDAVHWTSDLTADYVKLNAEYTT